MVAAYEENLHKISLPANADLSTTGQYRFVTVNSSGRIALTGAAARADGVLQDKPDALGRPGCVALGGVTKIIVAAGGLTAGDDVASAANGAAETAGTGDIVNGRALQTGTSGEIVSILLTPGLTEPIS